MMLVCLLGISALILLAKYSVTASMDLILSSTVFPFGQLAVRVFCCSTKRPKGICNGVFHWPFTSPASDFKVKPALFQAIAYFRSSFCFLLSLLRLKSTTSALKGNFDLCKGAWRKPSFAEKERNNC